MSPTTCSATASSLPNNATLVVVGDVDADVAPRRGAFGAIPRERRRRAHTAEPNRPGTPVSRFAEGTTTYLKVAATGIHRSRVSRFGGCTLTGAKG